MKDGFFTPESVNRYDAVMLSVKEYVNQYRSCRWTAIFLAVAYKNASLLCMSLCATARKHQNKEKLISEDSFSNRVIYRFGVKLPSKLLTLPLKFAVYSYVIVYPKVETSMHVTEISQYV